MSNVRLKAEVRFLAWIGAALAFCVVTAPRLLSFFGQAAGDALSGLVAAIPILVLLGVVFALRWSEFVRVADGGAGETTLPVRVLGGATVGGLVALVPLSGESLAGSGVAVVLTFYATSLLIMPTARRFIFPYAAVCAATVAAPAVLLWAFGEPLATLSSGLSARLAGIAGLPVLWQGTQFEILSKTGEAVSGVVTPSCSSVTSVTMFLGLLALMQLDFRKGWRQSAKVAFAGALALTLLDSIRIFILLWAGYEYGAGTLWGLHDWIGYALFLGFFLTILPIYSRMGGPMTGAGIARGAPAARAPTASA